MFSGEKKPPTEHTSPSFPPPSVYVPVLHSGELGSGLLEVVVVAVGEGAQAARYQCHRAEPGTGLAGRVGAGGVLLVVLAITRGLQPMVGARKRHLHDCCRSWDPFGSLEGYLCV